MKSKIICEMSGQDIKMLMMLFLYFFVCSVVSHLPFAAPYTVTDWLTSGRVRNHWRLVWMGGEVVSYKQYVWETWGWRLLCKKRGSLFIFNHEIMSRYGLQYSEVSTTIPIVKAPSAMSCESQKQWPNKSKKDCLQLLTGLALVERFWPQSSLRKSQHRQVTMVQGGCLLLEQAPCMRHLRKTVISELQINIWDKILLISVLLPSK